MSDREQVLNDALRRVHGPESFGRAIVDASLRGALESGADQFDVQVSLSPDNPDGTIPVCFLIFSEKICINIPVA